MGASTFTLEGRLNVPFSEAELVVLTPRRFRPGQAWKLDRRHTVAVDGPFGAAFPPFGLNGVSWIAPATIRRGRRRIAAIELEANRSSAHASELSVRPASRRPQRRSGRRMRRYLASAHATADLVGRYIRDASSSDHHVDRTEGAMSLDPSGV